MDRDIDVLSYLPPVLREFKENQEIAKVENPQIVRLWQATEQAMNDQFIETSTEYGVSRRERMLHIFPAGTDTLETRKFRLLTRYNEQAPYTRRVLRNLMNSLCGEDGYTLSIDVAQKVISVRVELTVRGMFDAVVDMLERITPVNMVMDVQLRFNQQSNLSKYTHAQLSQYTHDQLRNEVI
ncbi:putative phage tail protein [Robertmurraya sp. FSL W8-0741]|uniref:putative phage tail protein n=1 Tax=Robertmurraya sp. FSL W8-0741 TaxID=2954629 RepID=UPI0030F78F63